MNVFFRTQMDRTLRWLTALAALSIVLILTFLIGQIAYHGWETISWKFITGVPEKGMTEGGIFPAIFGTAALVIIMTVFVTPFGVFAAIYFSEYANRRSWIYTLARQAVNNLAGVPSIVFGLFGLGFFVQFVGKYTDKVLYGGELNYGQPAIIWAALTFALNAMAVAIRASECESPSRAAGEVAPILFVGAAYYLPYLPSKLNDQFMELGYHIFILSTQSPDVDATKPLLYATVFVLLALTFALNAMAVAIRARMRIAQRSV